jgi:DNA repair exonuclease SbcCD ATPase subunit
VNEQATGALSLDDVSRRFADSERTLAAARERLERLATAEENGAASAASLQQASEAVREFAQRASALIGELEQAQKETREVLEAGARFLDGTELRELKEVVGQLTQTVSERLGEIERRVGDVEAADIRALQAEQALADVKAKLPGRTLKKLGLD